MTQIERLTGSAVHSWKIVIGRLDQVFSSTPVEDFQKEVAPGRNRLLYLLGHLTAVHDRMLPLLRIGDRLHPELDAEFVDNPDTHAAGGMSVAGLQKAWGDVNGKLTAAFESFTPDQWLEKHAAVSDEDFAKDPLRNRLSVVLSRTNHASFHTGQIRLIK